MGLESFETRLIEKAEALAGGVSKHNRGSMIFTQGSQGSSFFVIKEGAVELQFDGTSRRTLFPGDFFGEIGAIGKLRRTAGAVCIKPTVLIELTNELYQRLAEENPDLADEIKSKYMLRLLHSKLRAEPSLFETKDKAFKSALELFRSKTLQKDETLFEETNESTGIYFVLTGKVNIQRKNELLGQRGPGKFVGEIGPLHGVKRTATVVAAEETEVLHCPKGKLKALLRAVPSLEKYLRKLASRRVIATRK